MGLSDKATPTPSLEALRLCSVGKPVLLARPAGYLGGGISVASLLSEPSLAPFALDSEEAEPLGLLFSVLREGSGATALVMMAERAIPECWAIPAEQGCTRQ